jgi:hypothetical protein
MVVQHSMLFYWWPVWAVGFLLALVAYFEGTEMAIVPGGTVAESGRVVQGHDDGPHDVLIVMKDRQLPRDSATKAPIQPHLRTGSQPYLGIIFMTTLLLVIVITNVPLRGLWSVVAIVLILLVVVGISGLGWWQDIVLWFSLLDIHMNAMGYLFVSLVLFTIWAITVFWFDRQVYSVFTPGLMVVRETIGGGEVAYDLRRMTVEHLRDDLFRHWILGLGSGDLVFHPVGPQTREIRLANVLFVSSRLRLINEL